MAGDVKNALTVALRVGLEGRHLLDVSLDNWVGNYWISLKADLRS